MKKLQVVLTGIILLFLMQFTLISCEDNSEIIKNQNIEQIQTQTKAIVPGHVGEDDDDEYEEGS